MESRRNKRKLGNEEEENDDKEEEKVEKFFALIRSTRETRARLRNVPNGSKEEEKKKQEEKSIAAVWNPTFQPEDFMEDSKSMNPLVVKDAGPSLKREQEQEKETKEGGEDSSLDLKLSL
ncbi:hypothetical protein CRYUN_Cryun09bG0170900 [Craigia yunnanensis]